MLFHYSIVDSLEKGRLKEVSGFWFQVSREKAKSILPCLRRGT
jgi:hypothetical protein